MWRFYTNLIAKLSLVLTRYLSFKVTLMEKERKRKGPKMTFLWTKKHVVFALFSVCQTLFFSRILQNIML